MKKIFPLTVSAEAPSAEHTKLFSCKNTQKLKISCLHLKQTVFIPLPQIRMQCNDLKSKDS